MADFRKILTYGAKFYQKSSKSAQIIKNDWFLAFMRPFWAKIWVWGCSILRVVGFSGSYSIRNRKVSPSWLRMRYNIIAYHRSTPRIGTQLGQGSESWGLAEVPSKRPFWAKIWFLGCSILILVGFSGSDSICIRKVSPIWLRMRYNIIACLLYTSDAADE